MTNEEREGIRAAARRYVHEQAPSPPIEVLERIARIILQARASNRPPDRADGSHGESEAA
jgi:hypothetical protein